MEGVLLPVDTATAGPLSTLHHNVERASAPSQDVPVVRQRSSTAVLLLVVLCLPIGAAPCEWAAGIALAAALFLSTRREQPLIGPVLAVCFSLLIPSLPYGSAGVLAALGKTWPLILLVALPPILASLERTEQTLIDVRRIGLLAAAAAALWAMAQLLLQGQPPWDQPARGPFSHHLTLGYALLPATAVAVHRRSWLLSVMLGAGVLASGASGPLLGLALIITSMWLSPLRCLFVGVGISLLIMSALIAEPDLQIRLTHWTAGAQLTLESGLGQGPIDSIRQFQLTESQLSSTVRPEQHAHDSALQWGILGGVGAWLAWIWLLTQLWSLSGVAGRASIAVLCVGALTQDVFGDLEVVRALCAWCLLSATPINTEPISAEA
jgi:hypothetical protein